MYARPVCPAFVRCCVQVPLMAALPTAQGAMRAHRGVAAVAMQGLGFLVYLSVAEANRVSGWARFGHPRCGSLRLRFLACPVHPALVHCCVQVPLMAAFLDAQAAMDAHRGVVAVAMQGLGFLWNLSAAEVNRVSFWA